MSNTGITPFRGNAQIVRGSIRDSLIDMQGRPITQVQDPVSAQDAATKAYVDKGSRIFPVVLNGQAPTPIGDLGTGAFFVTVSGAELYSSAPCATFTICRNSLDVSTAGNRLAQCVGQQTEEGLLLQWNGGDPVLYLSKTDDGYDGEYVVKIL